MSDIPYSAWPNRKTRATCHSDRPLHAKGRCYPCYRKQHRLDNLEHMKIASKRRNDKYRKNSPRLVMSVKLKTRYGLSLDDVEKMREHQSNRCKICLKPFSELGKKEVHLDHNHETGKARSILCRACNLGIGFLRENPFALARSIAYLKMHNEIPEDINWTQVTFKDLHL